MKNKFLLTSLLLVIGGLITKILSLIIKIVLTRSISTECLGTYMMLMPTFLLIINIASFGLPTAISKLVAEDNKSNKKILISALPISIIINIILMITIFIIAPILSKQLLHNKDLYLGIISIAIVIPFTTISSIIRSYFFGKNKVIPHILSNIVESIIKLLIYYYYLPTLKYKSISYIICFLVLCNVISEIVSIITMMLFLPKNINISRKDIIPSTYYIKDTLSISIPNTTSKLIGSIGFFLEPIILSTTLKSVGYSTKYITYNYGIISGYVIPLIMLPSFFTLAISQSLLPAISKDYSNNNIKSVKRKIKLALFLSIIIGSISTFIFILFPKELLNLIYNTSKGIRYLRVLSPIFFFEYIISILSSSLEAMGYSFIILKGTFISTLIRTITLFLLSLFKIGLWSLIISHCIQILYTTIYYYFNLNKKLSNFT